MTVRRIARSLTALGCEVDSFAIDQLSPEQLVDRVKRFRPELLHAFHGNRGGKVAHALSKELGLPYMVTITGSDVYEALSDLRAHETREALRGAVRVVAFHPCVKKRLAEHLPTLDERWVVIPQGVELPVQETGTAPAGEHFLLPGGLRRVKNILFPFPFLKELHDRRPEIRVSLVGPVVDAEYAVEVFEALEAYPFIRYLGGVLHEEMAPLYQGAAVVLNCSLFEGGMANTVLEGMAHGKALLVSDIEGNRSLVKDGVTGLLYRDGPEFLEKGERLAADVHLRNRLGQAARALVQEHYSPEREGRAYLDLYQGILAG